MFFARGHPRLLFIHGTILVFLILFSSTATIGQGRKLDLAFPLLMADGAYVTSILVLPDGKILVAGSFTTLGPVVREDILRLNADGSIDPDFNAGTGVGNSTIEAVELQPDGKIFIGGTFNQVNGVFGSPLARLNANGSLDNTFIATGLDMTFVYDVELQPDGKVLASASNLIGSSFIARFSSTGASEPAQGQSFYNGGGGVSGYRVEFDASDNKIIAVSRGTNNQGKLFKILPSGAADPAFDILVTAFVPQPVLNIVLIGNGRILVFGAFETVAGVQRKSIAIVNANGTVDSSLISVIPGLDTVSAVAVQPDGKIVIGFWTSGNPGGKIARLNTDGSVDPTFDSGRGANKSVRALGFDSGSRLLAGGTFFRYRGFPRAGIVRLTP